MGGAIFVNRRPYPQSTDRRTRTPANALRLGTWAPQFIAALTDAAAAAASVDVSADAATADETAVALAPYHAVPAPTAVPATSTGLTSPPQPSPPPPPVLVTLPYPRDLRVLAGQTARLLPVMASINANCAAVVTWLTGKMPPARPVGWEHGTQRMNGGYSGWRGGHPGVGDAASSTGHPSGYLYPLSNLHWAARPCWADAFAALRQPAAVSSTPAQPHALRTDPHAFSASLPSSSSPVVSSVADGIIDRGGGFPSSANSSNGNAIIPHSPSDDAPMASSSVGDGGEKRGMPTSRVGCGGRGIGSMVTFELSGTWWEGAATPASSSSSSRSDGPFASTGAASTSTPANGEEGEGEEAHHQLAQRRLEAFYDACGLIDAVPASTTTYATNGAPSTAAIVGNGASYKGGSSDHVDSSDSSSAFSSGRGIIKGPSFGLTFTVLTPFMYLAHYDLVRTHAGK